jgi:c-di-GMP-binding flagellar brake protein YcgR
MPIEDKDRRRHPRLDLAAPCKVYHPASRRFAAARTKNVSAGGALLRVETGRPLMPGEPIDVALSLEPKPLLQSVSMIAARVIRSLPIGDNAQELAVRFEREIDLAQAA